MPKPTRSEIKFQKAVRIIQDKLPEKYKFILNTKSQKRFSFDPINFFTDFYFPNAKLVVEIDGGYHKAETQKIKDKWRSELIKGSEERIKLIRFNNEQILEDYRLSKAMFQLLRTIANQIKPEDLYTISRQKIRRCLQKTADRVKLYGLDFHPTAALPKKRRHYRKPKKNLKVNHIDENCNHAFRNWEYTSELMKPII